MTKSIDQRRVVVAAERNRIAARRIADALGRATALFMEEEDEVSAPRLSIDDLRGEALVLKGRVLA